MSDREAKAKLERIYVHLMVIRSEARTQDEWLTGFEATQTVARILRDWGKRKEMVGADSYSSTGLHEPSRVTERPLPDDHYDLDEDERTGFEEAWRVPEEGWDGERPNH